MPGSTSGLAPGYAPRPASGQAPFQLPITGANLTFERQLPSFYSSPSLPINSQGTDQNQVPPQQNGNF